MLKNGVGRYNIFFLFLHKACWILLFVSFSYRIRKEIRRSFIFLNPVKNPVFTHAIFIRPDSELIRESVCACANLFVGEGNVNMAQVELHRKCDKTKSLYFQLSFMKTFSLLEILYITINNTVSILLLGSYITILHHGLYGLLVIKHSMFTRPIFIRPDSELIRESVCACAKLFVGEGNVNMAQVES
jgi:hypothetical protein